MHRLCLQLCTLACACSFAVSAFADVVILDNGDRITGTITGLAGGKLTINTGYAGDVKIDLGKIQSMQSEGSMTVELQNNRRLYGTISGSGARLNVKDDSGTEPTPVDATKITDIVPGHVTGEEWKFSGHLNAGYSDSSGNTDVGRAHFDGELVAQKRKNRFTTGVAVNRASDTGVETESNALGYFKFDHFFTAKWYNYANTTLEHDKFKDIRLRTTYGVGTGYQAIASSRTNLALEAGVDYVTEDFYVAQDDQFPALRLALRFDHYLIPARLQVFQTTEGFISAGSVKQSFARTKTGFRFPLMANFVGTAEYDIDWDANPQAGRTSMDRILLFSLGYKW